MRQKTIHNVIFPLLRREAVALIGISTLQVGFNFWSTFLQQKYKGTNIGVFNTVIVETICASCKAAGNMDCKHMAARTPFWLRDPDFMQYLYAGNEASMNRETKNVGSEENMRQWFNPDALHFLNDWSKCSMPLPNCEFKYIYISLDPAAGGTGSKYCALAFVHFENKSIVSIFFFNFKSKNYILHLPSPHFWIEPGAWIFLPAVGLSFSNVSKLPGIPPHM